MNESLQNWIITNRLSVIPWTDTVLTIEGFGKALVVEHKVQDTLDGERNIIFDDQFSLVLSDNEIDQIMDEELAIDYLIFQFGDRWYYTEDPEVKELKPLLYIGKEIDVWDDAFPYLGVHGCYDLCNGSRDYADWATKAVFANIKVMGIVEENTLGGALAFQNAMQAKQIKPIIGETVTVKGAIDTYEVKLYVTNGIGWKNLLLINTHLNVFNEKFIHETDLLSHSEGLVCVFTPEVKLGRILTRYKEQGKFVHLFYQFDVSQWDSDEKDKQKLLSMQNYLKNYYTTLPPVLIIDSYYLDKDDAKIRRDLNAIGGVAFKNQSSDQYFKTPNETALQLNQLFKDDDTFFNVLNSAIENTKLIGEFNFTIETGKLHLPKYEMSEEEARTYESNEDLFWSLIESGLSNRDIIGRSNESEYLDRVEKETKVIIDAKLVDYFLITWDVLNWAANQGIKTGYGRGSAAGSLVAYLLNIVHVDPLEYDLLWERFLNEGRLYKKRKVKGYVLRDATKEEIVFQSESEEEVNNEKANLELEDPATYYKVEPAEIEIKVTGSMPDIDNDIAGERREEVKRYLEEKYGANRVASIGTYGTFKIKGALQAMGRRVGADMGMTRYVTGAIQDDDLSFTGLFKYAQQVPIVKSYIMDYPELIEKLPLIFNQPFNTSMHAAGVIIIPQSENGIYDQLPVKKVDGVIISEWEMQYVEQAGFLKMDLLGLKQLDKFDDIIKMIKEQLGEELTVHDIPLDDPKVYELFSRGKNEDVFQFGGGGLKGYTQELQPTTINDLIATVALYRPGPIDTQAHMQYVARKNGREEPTYPYGTESILKETYGNIVYQEQVIKIVQVVGGFTANEADDVRKAMGKKDAALMAKYKSQFVEGAVKNGSPQQEAAWLWDQMEVFAGYAFNKSHATCYAITGYHCQWFKVNYPLQFWTTSLRKSTDKQIPARLSEMYSSSEIVVAPPDINKSTKQYESDVARNTIYWTITSIKQVGEAAVEAILEEREKGGDFYSIEEFVKRMKPYSRAVKKNTIVNLILAGAFDQVEKVDSPKMRFSLLQKFFNFIGSQMSDELLQMKVWKEYKWILKQRALSGLGKLDFQKMTRQTSLSAKHDLYLTNREILEIDVNDLPDEVLIGGLVTQCTIKGSAARPFVVLQVSDGETLLDGVIWNETFLKHKELFESNIIDKLILFTARIKYDNIYKKTNVFNTVDNKSRLVVIEE